MDVDDNGHSGKALKKWLGLSADSDDTSYALTLDGGRPHLFGRADNAAEQLARSSGKLFELNTLGFSGTMTLLLARASGPTR